MEADKTFDELGGYESSSAGKRHNFPRGMNSGNNFPQNTRESKFVAFRDKSA